MPELPVPKRLVILTMTLTNSEDDTDLLIDIELQVAENVPSSRINRIFAERIVEQLHDVLGVRDVTICT